MTPGDLDQAIANTRAHLLSLRNERGWWEGELSSSALSTATAIVALHTVDGNQHRAVIEAGAQWLIEHQNADGGWGDTTISKSNLSTTLLCWSACSRLRKDVAEWPDSHALASAAAASIVRAASWIRERTGSLDADAIARAVIARYGKDKTFSVPILMHCAICGTLSDEGSAWQTVMPLPFELAALPRSWFGAIGLPVVSYALPALIAIGHARFYHAPPPAWNPLRWLRSLLWPRARPMLKSLQPSSGGYLEATPLTSFVTMALASSGERDHPCVPLAVEFLLKSQQPDGSWAIDTNLATWGTTLALKALVARHSDVEYERPVAHDIGASCHDWLLAQQYKTIHPFTNAAPGGWAWTDLPGGVPDADDTSGALVALWHLAALNAEGGRTVLSPPHPPEVPGGFEDENDTAESAVALAGASALPANALPAVESGIAWLLDLQNHDGGIPTFCRGWGALPFDHSTPEITAHALQGWWLWEPVVSTGLRSRIRAASARALRYLHKTQQSDGSWLPLWFGNEHAKDEANPVYGTAMVVSHLSGCETLAAQTADLIQSGCRYLLSAQKSDGSWGGDPNAPSSIEETAVALSALNESGASFQLAQNASRRLALPLRWLLDATKSGTHFPPSPIGLYFARLWYHEKLYPVVWTLGALKSGAAALNRSEAPKSG